MPPTAFSIAAMPAPFSAGSTGAPKPGAAPTVQRAMKANLAGVLNMRVSLDCPPPTKFLAGSVRTGVGVVKRCRSSLPKGVRQGLALVQRSR